MLNKYTIHFEKKNANTTISQEIPILRARSDKISQYFVEKLSQVKPKAETNEDKKSAPLSEGKV